jgi:hypothetical protein
MKGKKFPKNQKALLLILPLLAAVMVSGCTGSGTGVTIGNGMAILNWEPTYSSVESGDELQLRIRIQNQGEAIAKDVRAVLSGINLEDWNGRWARGEEIDIGDLLPPDSIQGTQGQVAQDTFDIVAPDLPKGTTQQYNPSIRIYYDYKTNAAKQITLVNENELKRLQDKGETISSTDTKTSAGPLKVTVTTGKFIKARESGSYYSNTFPITIDIQNVGGGVVSYQDHPEDDYKVDIDMDYPSSRLRLLDCKEVDDGYFTLWKGKDASITCNMQITYPPLSTEENNIKIYLDYEYYVDSRTTIAVTGNEEGYYY